MSSPPVAVLVLDRVGEIVGALALAYLAHDGRLGGEVAGGMICALLGVQTGLRNAWGRSSSASSSPPTLPPPSVGAIGLVLLAALAHLRHVAVAAVVALAVLAQGCATSPDAATVGDELLRALRAARAVVCSDAVGALTTPPPAR